MTMTLKELHDPSNTKLLSLIPRGQLDRLFDEFLGDIAPEFLGFVGIYDRLAEIIPAHWTVVDLGCAYAPQAFFFTGHKKYIGVNLGPVDDRCSAANTEHYAMSIAEFCTELAPGLDHDTTFAICSYVPPWGADNMSLARETFKNVFTYYPHGSGAVGPLTADNRP